MPLLQRVWQFFNTPLMWMLLLFSILVGLRYRLNETSLRWLVYALPVIIPGWIVYARLRKKALSTWGAVLLRGYFAPLLLLYGLLLVVSFLNLLFGGRLMPRFFEEAVFLLAPIAAVAGLFFILPDPHNPDLYARVLFWGMVIAYLFAVDFQLLSGFRDLVNTLTREGFLIGSLNVRSESGLAFIFGLLWVYFIVRRDWLYSLVCALPFLLSYKRLAYVAMAATVLIGLGLYLPYRYRAQWMRKLLPVMGLLANLTAVIGLLLLAYGNLDTPVTHITGRSTDHITMGRRYLYEDIVQGLRIEQGDIPLIGTGIGSITTYLERIDSHLVNPHSDILKSYIEFGALGFLIWIAVFYVLHRHGLGLAMLLINLNLLWLTDNVMIYFEVMFVFYVLSGLLFIEIRRGRAMPHETPA